MEIAIERAVPTVSLEEFNEHIDVCLLGLEDIMDTLKLYDKVVATESYSETATGFMKEAIVRTYDTYNLPTPEAVMSEEFPTKVQTICLESLGDWFLKIWEAIKAAFKKVKDYIVGIWEDTEAKAQDCQTSFASSEKTVKEMASKPEVQEKQKVAEVTEDTSALGQKMFKNLVGGNVSFNSFCKFITNYNQTFDAISKANEGFIDDLKLITTYVTEIDSNVGNEAKMQELRNKLVASKWKTTEAISKGLRVANDIPADLTNARPNHDSRMARKTAVMFGGTKYFYLKPLDPESFYVAYVHDRIISQDPSIKYFKVDELGKLAELGREAIVKAGKFSDHSKETVSMLDKQEAIIDKHLKNLVDKDGADDTKEVLKISLSLIRGAILLIKKQAGISNKVTHDFLDLDKFIKEQISWYKSNPAS